PAADPAAANALRDRTGYDKRDPDDYRRAADSPPPNDTVAGSSGCTPSQSETQSQHDIDAIGPSQTSRITPLTCLIRDLLAAEDNEIVLLPGYRQRRARPHAAPLVSAHGDRARSQAATAIRASASTGTSRSPPGRCASRRRWSHCP